VVSIEEKCCSNQIAKKWTPAREGRGRQGGERQSADQGGLRFPAMSAGPNRLIL